MAVEVKVSAQFYTKEESKGVHIAHHKKGQRNLVALSIGSGMALLTEEEAATLADLLKVYSTGFVFPPVVDATKDRFSAFDEADKS